MGLSSSPKFSRWKTIQYILKRDKLPFLFSYFIKNSFRSLVILFRLFSKKNSLKQNDSFFFFEIEDLPDLEILLQRPSSHLIIGFSYCSKPLNCPSLRHSSSCQPQENHSACTSCFFRTLPRPLPSRCSLHWIPDVHFIGEQILTLSKTYSNIVFVITACDFSLRFFAPWAHALNTKGIGIRLLGKTCSHMLAFSTAEKGIKNNLTKIPLPAEQYLLKLLKTLA